MSVFKCKFCNYETKKKANWDRHLQTQKHILIVNNKRHSCEACNFHTNNKVDYTRHLQTTKHKNKVNMDTNSDANTNS
jgi:hypothetical protein